MTNKSDDYHKLLAQKHFLGEIEQGIRFANREIIHGRIPKVTKDDFLAFAVSVGRLRAHYLEAAWRMATADKGEEPDQSEIKEIRTRREMFEEGKAAFESLRDAIEKGYVEVADIEAAKK